MSLNAPDHLHADGARAGSRVVRRRGSVMILIITLLSILFVIGVAFLATMNFEAEMIVAERAIGRTRESVRSAESAVDRLMQEALIGGSDSSLAGAVVSSTVTGVVVDLPGVHSLAAPIEPYRVYNAAGTQSEFRYRWYTDTEWAMTGKHAIEQPTNPAIPCQGGANQGTYRGCEILASGFSFSTGDPAISGDPGNGQLPYEMFEGDYVAPVDVDGDGLRDSFQVNIKHLGFSREQQVALSVAVNEPGQVRDDVFLGLRVIPHGGMVNLNEAHPRLIETVFDLRFDDWPQNGNPPDPALDFFVHTPTQTQSDSSFVPQVFYPPALDEAPLRRRGFLPPRLTIASRLHGDRFARNASAPAVFFTSDIQRLFPPDTSRDGIRFWPVRYDEMSTVYDGIPLFDLRMDPLLTDQPPVKDPPEYDRRHLVTTTSHDDLLSRGAKTVSYDNNGTKQVLDFREAMLAANFRAWYDSGGNCSSGLLPFEYADYPQSIANPQTSAAPNGCCPGDPACELDFRKGRLQLSLSWLDTAFSNDGDADNDAITKEQRNALIYDTFAMMIANVVGPYWDTPVTCQYVLNSAPVQPSGQPCPSGTFCRFPSNVSPSPGALGYCASTAPYWYTPPSCNSTAECGPGPYICAGNTCVDAQIAGARQPAGQPAIPVQMPRPLALISRAAAELTANMIDYVDGVSGTNNAITDPDEVPTRIALRSFDFSTVNDNANPTSAGQELLDANGNPIYVYGVERQPYITEVTTFLNPATDMDVTSWAVELYNPYPAPIPGMSGGDSRFWIFVGTDPTMAVRIPINRNLPAAGDNLSGGGVSNGFTVLYNGAEADLTQGASPPGGNFVDLSAAKPKLKFASGDTIWLVRSVVYPEQGNATPPPTWIVVDQMKVGGSGTSGIGKNRTDLEAMISGFDSANPALYTIQRVVTDSPGNPSLHWTASIPDEAEGGQTIQTLGTFNNRSNNNLHPVEVRPLNIDSAMTVDGVSDKFALFDSRSLTPQVAFPTTGMMLMLTRHANHADTDYHSYSSAGYTALSFTRRLVEETKWYEIFFNNTTGQYEPTLVTVKEHDQIDNGRMPVFDIGSQVSLPGGGGATVLRSAHHLSPEFTAPRTPGGAAMLPWGQFVFDYFTALPLSNPGPYRVGNNEIDRWQAARPRVDMNGLRVHGRIDLNAAPWKVISGVPYAPLALLPDIYQNRMMATLMGSVPPGISNPELKAGILRSHTGQGIVGYREARQFNGIDSNGNQESSGDYGDGDLTLGTIGWRGWNMNPTTTGAPAARRGTGFLTVGELANVRHPQPSSAVGGFVDDFRMDRGTIFLAPNNSDYVNAVAGLAALSDWVTVKSHVFTVYGAIRGAPAAVDEATQNGNLSMNPVLRQQQLREIDERAIRFQETLDRLPILLGEPAPTRIGGGTLSAYSDSSTD